MKDTRSTIELDDADYALLQQMRRKGMIMSEHNGEFAALGDQACDRIAVTAPRATRLIEAGMFNSDGFVSPQAAANLLTM